MAAPDKDDHKALLSSSSFVPTSRAQTPWKLSPKFKLTSNHPRLSSQQLAAAHEALSRQHCNSWCLSRGRMPPVPPLHPAVRQLIADWFEAVDEDGSGTLEHHELMSALKAAHIPCDDQTITEMIELMDMNGDGVIGWDEFLHFMACEFHHGKSLTAGEWMMPSGTALNFGIMIGKLKRDKLMREILESEDMRHRWVTVASDPVQLAKEVATLSEAAQVAADMNNTLEAEMKAATGQKHSHGWSGTQQGLAAERLLHSLELESRLSRPASHQQAQPTHQRGMANVLAGSNRDSSTGSTLGLSTHVTRSDPRPDARASTSRLGPLVPSVTSLPPGDTVRRTSFDEFRSSPASPIMGSSNTTRATSRCSTDWPGAIATHHTISSVFRINSDTGNSSGTPFRPGMSDDTELRLPPRPRLPKVQPGSLPSRLSLPLSSHSSTTYSTQTMHGHMSKASGFLRVGLAGMPRAFSGLQSSSDAGSAAPLTPTLNRVQQPQDVLSLARRTGVAPRRASAEFSRV